MPSASPTAPLPVTISQAYHPVRADEFVGSIAAGRIGAVAVVVVILILVLVPAST